MTIGEYAQMINGEGWLKNGVHVRIDRDCVRELFTHQKGYTVSVPPSPNSAEHECNILVPFALCFFEGTPVSVGRGTDAPFQQFGHPAFILSKFQYSFTPNADARGNRVLNLIWQGMLWSRPKQ